MAPHPSQDAKCLTLTWLLTHPGMQSAHPAQTPHSPGHARLQQIQRDVRIGARALMQTQCKQAEGPAHKQSVRPVGKLRKVV
eukprot:365334-Chlamydomonas_euryale.AAC.19